jgi:hypothetical protein
MADKLVWLCVFGVRTKNVAKYRLIKNAYLTVIGAFLHYNRHFEKGEVFEKEAAFGDYLVLVGDYRIFIHKDRLKDCFELVWKGTGIFKKSPYFTENDDEA